MRFGPTATETALVDSMRRAQAGDRAAYALVLAHCRYAFDLLARERCPAGASEALVGQCLLTLHRARHTFDPRRSFGAWVEAIARHHGIGPARGSWRAWIDGLLHRLLQGIRAAGPETRRVRLRPRAEGREP